MWLDPRFADFIKRVAAEERAKERAEIAERMNTIFKKGHAFQICEGMEALMKELLVEDGVTSQSIRGWNENGATDHGGYVG